MVTLRLINSKNSWIWYPPAIWQDRKEGLDLLPVLPETLNGVVTTGENFIEVADYRFFIND